MKLADNKTPPDASHRRLLRQAGSVVTATGIAGIAGCTAPASVDEDETTNSESVTTSLDESAGPSEPDPSDLAGSIAPGISLEWMETNMSYEGWYDATLYNDSEWEFSDDQFYLRNGALFNIRVTDPAGETRTLLHNQTVEYDTYDEGEFHIEAVGSDAFLTAPLPWAQGYEFWISGTLAMEDFWVGFF